MVDFKKMLQDLKAERSRLDKTIGILEGVTGQHNGARTYTKSGAGKYGRTWTKKQREAQRKKMKAYWANKRKGN